MRCVIFDYVFSIQYSCSLSCFAVYFAALLYSNVFAFLLRLLCHLTIRTATSQSKGTLEQHNIIRKTSLAINESYNSVIRLKNYLLLGLYYSIPVIQSRKDRTAINFRISNQSGVFVSRVDLKRSSLFRV